MKTNWAIACLIYISTACNALSANSYYVAKDGDNTNPGTQSKPFLTIQKAADIAQPGGTLTPMVA
jgi:hypothetical protein